jgi:hypothetical protein
MMRREKNVVSVWQCTCCRMQVAEAGHPRRLKNRTCGQWRDFVREIQPAPARADGTYPKPR